jgi:hypothetical protein
MSINSLLDVLGRRATDKVTGFVGTVTSVSFDLYGCIQCIVVPPATKDAPSEGRWFDLKRLNLESQRVMPVPSFAVGSEPGPEDKPLQDHCR